MLTPLPTLGAGEAMNSISHLQPKRQAQAACLNRSMSAPCVSSSANIRSKEVGIPCRLLTQGFVPRPLPPCGHLGTNEVRLTLLGGGALGVLFMSHCVCSSHKTETCHAC